MFDVGQRVICVRKEPWRLIGLAGNGRGPEFGAECTVEGVLPAGTLISLPDGRVVKILTDSIDLAEFQRSSYSAKWFRPKEPNIEALRSLLVSKKQTEKV